MTPHRIVSHPPHPPTGPHPPHRTDDAEDRLVAAAVAGDDGAFSALAHHHRSGLHAHCRRILRSADAEDAVQEVLLRAWRSRSNFEGRSSFGWWLRCIATNTCLDVAQRRSRSSAMVGAEPDGDPSADEARTDPAVVVSARDAVEQAYLVAIRVLPPRQWAVLVLREVLRYSATDTAALLGDGTPSVNSALQRARATLDRHHRVTPPTAPAPPATAVEQDLVRRLVEAHDRADAAAVVATLVQLRRGTPVG